MSPNNSPRSVINQSELCGLNQYSVLTNSDNFWMVQMFHSGTITLRVGTLQPMKVFLVASLPNKQRSQLHGSIKVTANGKSCTSNNRVYGGDSEKIAVLVRHDSYERQQVVKYHVNGRCLYMPLKRVIDITKEMSHCIVKHIHGYRICWQPKIMEAFAVAAAEIFGNRWWPSWRKTSNGEACHWITLEVT